MQIVNYCTVTVVKVCEFCETRSEISVKLIPMWSIVDPVLPALEALLVGTTSRSMASSVGIGDFPDRTNHRYMSSTIDG